MAAPVILGNLLPDNSVIFRALKSASFLNDSKTDLVDKAYFCHKGRDEDGLSFGRTAENAAMALDKNHGVSSIPVGDVHNLGRELDVYADSDPGFAGHALLKGLPMYEDNPTLASDIAWELVHISTIVHNRSYYPPGHPRHRP